MADQINQLSIIKKFSYGVGHVLNDLCASMWFTYLLIFYHKVLGMNNILAGNLLLIGQVADALATPFVGYESDRINGFCGYGKRKSWHLLGCVCVAASFAFIFMPELSTDPLYYTVAADYTSLLYYAPFIVIFQFGWASTQISHLSLIPSLSDCEHVKVGLNSIRTGFTVISNLAVYLIAWFLLTRDNDGREASTDDITPLDYITFRTLALIVIATGAVFALIFHVGTRESTVEDMYSESLATRRRMYVLCWLKTGQFYAVGLLYMFTRLIVNMSQVYLSMYLTETLSLSKEYIAIVPLVVYISGFIATFPMRFLSRKFGKKVLFFVGLLFVIGGSVWFYFLREDNKMDEYLVMAAAALNGIGGSTVLVLSLSMTADLIDQNTESAAFVYGAMSFTDKLSNGIAVQIIQIMHPCKATACCAACAPYYRNILTFVPIGVAVLAFVTLFFIKRRETEYLPVSSGSDSESDSPRSAINRPSHSSYGSLNNDPIISTESSPDPELSSSPLVGENLLYRGERGARSSVDIGPLLSTSRQRPSFIVGSTPDRSLQSPSPS